MKKKSFLQQFTATFLVNTFFCTILTLTLYQFDIPGYALALPIIFLLLTSFQQSLKTPQHALFIALLIVLIPLISFLVPPQKTIVYSLFYLYTLLSCEFARHYKRELPFPDVVPFIFMLVAFLLEFDEEIIFGLVVAYFLSRITTLYLKVIRMSHKDGNVKDD